MLPCQKVYAALTCVREGICCQKAYAGCEHQVAEAYAAKNNTSHVMSHTHLRIASGANAACKPDAMRLTPYALRNRQLKIRLGDWQVSMASELTKAVGNVSMVAIT